MALLDIYFYNSEHIRDGFRRVKELAPSIPSVGTGLEFFAALFLVIVAFTLIYALGQLLNGFSALVLDRLVVKKLLKYPFNLYLRRLEAPSARSDHDILRDAMLESSYAIFCLNLVPLVFMELIVIAFSFRLSELPAYLIIYSARHPILESSLLSLGAAFLVYLHFGRPSRTRARRYYNRRVLSDAQLRSFNRQHWALVLLLVSLISLSLWRGEIWIILLLPLLNSVVGLVERYAPRRLTQKILLGPFLKYMKACFANPIYFAANLVGYSDLPSAQLIRMVKDEFVEQIDPKDFFWVAYLKIQNRGEGASQTAYHFLATYGMVRNLCNSTAFALTLSVGFFLMKWPLGHGPSVVAWTLTQSGLVYALFARYLYVYGPYFSKYVLRAAAFTHATKRVEISEP